MSLAILFHFLCIQHISDINTGCGRKNTPIWEGHSFGWGARTVVGSTSSNSSVRAVFNVYHDVVGRTSAFIVKGFIKKMAGRR